MSSERLIGVIGSGTMGAGIAHAAAAAGFVVKTLDVDGELVKKAYATIHERLNDRVARGRISDQERDDTMARLQIAEGYGCIKDAECIIEAVPEDFDLKRKVFADLDRIVSDRTLLATNTSSFSIAKIADGLKHAGRFLGMHFFNPAPVMKLVEIVRGPATGEQAMVDARAICSRMAKTPVKVQDSPGFIGNRVNRPFYLEALRLLEDGEADIRSIDDAMRTVGGFKMGPFELLDLIGVDVNLRVTESVWADFGKPARFTPSGIQKKLVASGHFGRKSGQGFYHHDGKEPTPAFETQIKDASGWKPSKALQDFAARLDKPADRAMWLYARVFMAVMNEGALVADSIALPRDVNLTMELGFNYPEGPLATADFVGLDIVQRLLTEFREQTGGDERYKANALLDKRVANGDFGETTSRGFLYHAL